jgi:hypothetical protein
MKNPSNQAKTRFNAKTYTQVKVSVNPAIAAAFKSKCETAGVSMACVLSRFMDEYGSTPVKCRQPVREDAQTRKKRRSMIDYIIKLMMMIKAGEENLRDNMPENLRNSDGYELAEESISNADEIIDMLRGIY